MISEAEMDNAFSKFKAIESLVQVSFAESFSNLAVLSLPLFRGQG
jgi:hypothetical protein